MLLLDKIIRFFFRKENDINFVFIFVDLINVLRLKDINRNLMHILITYNYIIMIDNNISIINYNYYLIYLFPKLVIYYTIKIFINL